MHAKGVARPSSNRIRNFDAGCGWPSFDREEEAANIVKVVDRSHGMVRVEVRCSGCDSHLGHVFPDGPTATGTRYCINGVCLTFSPNSRR